MSRPKFRTRKSKLVPRSTDGGELEIKELTEPDVSKGDEEEPQIKITNTMSLLSQPGPSKDGSIQFKVDIEVEEWIDDELFIEENFNKMQTEKLSMALDKEIVEEADWTNEEYGKIWAETASDSEHEEKPLNEYEKIIKNQVDPSVLETFKVKPESSEEVPVSSIDRPGSSNDRPVSSKDCLPREMLSKNGARRRSKRSKKTEEPKIEMPRILRKQPKRKKNIHSSCSLLKPIIRQYKRPGPKSKTMEESIGEKLTAETASVYSKIFKWPDNKSDKNYSETKRKTYSVSETPQTDIDLSPATLEDQMNTLINTEQCMEQPPSHKRMTITELDEFAKTHIPDEVLKPDDKTLVSLNEIIIEEEKILATSQEIASNKDPIDHVLDIEVRNRMGYTRFVPIKMSREDALIDFGLRSWYKWLGHKKAMLSPLAYKCYICNEAWWHLDPFRIHLKKHLMVTVSFEKEHQECSIVAHNGKNNYRMPPIHDELCWQCGKDYLHHCKLVYRCRGCQTVFYNCKTLAEHEGICLNIWKEQMEVQKTKDVKAYKCKICPQIFFTEQLLHSHQYVSHVPRSDIPISVQSYQANCIYCHKSYVDYAFHYCIRRVLRCQCSRHFPSMKALKAHLNAMKSKVVCTVCNEIVLKECMMPNHLVTHNRNYLLVYKCLMCVGKNIMLENATMVTRHCEYVHHMNKYLRKMWCFVQVPIPATLLSKIVVTKHRPTCLHERLKATFLKDMLKVFQAKPVKDTGDGLEENNSQDSLDGDESQNYLEGNDEQDSLEGNDNQDAIERNGSQDTLEGIDSQDALEGTDAQDTLEGQIFQDSSEEKDSSLQHDRQDTAEEQETPTIKIENIMENYFEEDSSNLDIGTEFKPKIIDTISIKQEIEENVEGTEVDPADLMDMTHSEFLSVVKKEPDNYEMDTSERSYQLDTSSIDATTSNNSRDFSIQILEHLSNRDNEDDDEIIDDNLHFCLNCDFEGTKKQFKAHLKVCDFGEIARKKQKLTCTKCDKHFTSLKEYVQHLPKHGFVRCKCLDCNKDFPNLSTWTLHIKIHMRRSFTLVKLMSKGCDLYRCWFCKEFVERKIFFKHWEKHFEPSQKKKLPLPAMGMEGKGGMSPETLSRIQEIFAMAKTHLIPKNCIICGKHFGRINEKKRHLVEHLLDAALERIVDHFGLVCQFCGNKVLRPNEFRAHMREHAAITLYHCEFCNKSFSDSSNFVKHKKVHDVDMYICDICNKKFLAKNSLRAHLKTHRPDPLHCTRCPSKLFYSESAYNRHIKLYHDRPSGFRCKYCRQIFPTVRQNWDHLWEVHKVRSQIADCPMCDEKFRKAQDLKSHLFKDHNVKKMTYVPVDISMSDLQ